MKLLRNLGIPMLVGVILIAWSLGGGTGAALAKPVVAQASCNTWNVVSSPNPGSQNVLDGVATISASDVWAVGYSDNTALTEHWDGSSWSVVPNATLSDSGYLFAVTAIATNDVWAVGQVGSLVLTEHWDGTSWSQVSAPTPGSSSYSIFVSVSASATNDVWAVGSFTNSKGKSQALIEHWDGSSWSIVSSPNPVNATSSLLGVAATSSNSAWAVGTHKTSSGLRQALIEQWNGTSWSIASSPAMSGSTVLWSVSPIPGGNQFVAAGTTQVYGLARPLIEQWNGSSWSIVKSQYVAGTNNDLYSVAALSSTDIWAVGLLFSSNGSTNQALIEHQNGSGWKDYYSPNPNGDSILTGVAGVSNTKTAWAVGVSYDGSGNSYTVTEEVCP